MCFIHSYPEKCLLKSEQTVGEKTKNVQYIGHMLDVCYSYTVPAKRVGTPAKGDFTAAAYNQAEFF